MPARPIAEHFADRSTQQHAVRLAVWIFIASEVLLFAGLFAVYLAYRARYPIGFAAGVAHGELLLGSLNTIVLLGSSLTIALGVWAMRMGRGGLAAVLVAATLVLGTVFLCIKAIEYARHFDEGMLPGPLWSAPELPSGAPIYFTLYWMMTALHAFHVVAGMLVLAWLGLRVIMGSIDVEDPVALEGGAMYWHLVDIIWLFLWPLLYLVK
jgi:cytochrome c oxidase subunit 3